MGIAGGYREGYTGVLPSHRGETLLTAKRAPEALEGLEWVVRRVGRAPETVGGDGHIPTLRARSVWPCQPSLGYALRMPTYGQKGEISPHLL